MRAAVLLLASSALAANAQQVPSNAPAGKGTTAWYDHAVIYEIYPRSFQDTDGNGIGDLKGVTAHLDYLQKLGIDAIWLTPFFPSPNLDFGYDISNYTDVAPEYGTMADWDNLVSEAKKRNIRVLVDFVLNHTSDKHPWFIESASNTTNPKRNWYVWKDGKPGPTGTPNTLPPTNWVSIFGGSTWTLDPGLDPKTSQWYYHIFAPYQPDVNWADPGLRKAMFDVVRFWLDHGASGFRLDAAPFLFEDQTYPDDPDLKGSPAGLKPYSNSRPENHGVMREMRAILDTYPGRPVLLGESPTKTIDQLNLVYGKNHDEVQLPMDFMVGDMDHLSAEDLKENIDDAETHLDGTATLFFSSHDHHRQLTLYGDGDHNPQIARVSAAATLLPGGTTLLYYGEELGMADLTAADLKGVPLGPKRPRADDRDPERSPMQWTAGTNAGFTTGTPWLPANPGKTTVNAAAEAADPTSMLHWYQSLIALRKTPAFATGTYLPLDSGNKQVFAFARTSGGGQGALVAMNLSPKPQQVHLAGTSLNLSGSTILLATPGVTAPRTTAFTLPPFAVLVTSTK